jgi:hypothetical protein
MTFCKINGWTIPIKDKGGRQQKLLNGNLAPAWTGRPNRQEKSIPSDWGMDSLFLSPENANTLEAILTGVPFHFPLDFDFWSDGGLSPQAGFGAFSFVNDGNQKVGRGYFDLTGGVITWSPELGEDWTVMVWLGTGSPPAWKNYVVRSDGAKWVDGVRNDLTGTAWLTVADGLVELDGGNKYDDLWIFPFSISDDFRAQFWLWTFSTGLQFNCPFDKTYLDVFRGKSPAVIGTTFTGGKFGDAVDFTGGAEEVRFAFGTPNDLFQIPSNRKTITVWVKTRSIVTGPDYAVSCNFSGSAGWSIQIVNPSGSGDYAIKAERRATVTDSAVTSLDLSFDEWVHVALVFRNAASGEPDLYVNGVSSGAPSPGGGVFSPTTGDLTIGRDGQTSANPMDGQIADLRLHSIDFSTQEVLDDYARGLAGRLPGNQPEPQSPYLILDGDAVGWEETPVLGSVNGETYLQHGGATWVNNARPVSFRLDEKAPPQKQDAIPVPDDGWLFDEMLIDDGGDLSPVFGTEKLVFGGSLSRPHLGPFGFGQSFESDGVSGNYLQANGGVSANLYGATVVTFCGWIYRNVTGVQHQVFNFSINGTISKIWLGVKTNDHVQAGGRSDPGDSFQLAEGATSVDANEWWLIGGEMDLTAKTAAVFLNGVLDGSSSSLSWANDEFTEGTGTPAGRFFQDTAAGNKINGALGSAMIWRRRLSSDEHLEIYNLGRRGIFK